MKRNLVLLLVMIMAVLFFTLHNARAQCPQDPNDLGICDTLYVETFDCDHEYEAEPGSFDSVRVAIYVTHDSNTFWSDYHGMYVQDSIIQFLIPLTFWHQPEGCADSVILPNWGNWNNTHCNPYDPRMSRSIFRDLVDEHTGDTVYNRMLGLASQFMGLEWDVRVLDIESHSCDGDSGHAWLLMSAVGGNRAWWEGSRILLATLTFHVYMSEYCDTTEIGIDSMFWPIAHRLTFLRPDLVFYIPRHFLPVKDTIYSLPGPLCGDCNGDSVVNSADVVYLINYLFVPGSPAPVPDTCIGDVNCDGVVNSADVVYLINHLFVPGSPPPCLECCDFKAKMEEFPGQKMERALPQKRPVPQKVPKAPGDWKRME